MTRSVVARGGTVDAVITGGGTAGHVFPALAVGRALVARGYTAERIHFIGSLNGMEGRLVPESGFAVTLLPGRGLVRRLSLANVAAAAGLVRAAARALVLLRRLRPRVVVSVGGFASVPTSLAAVVLGIPVVVVNVDAVPGLANRLVGRFAAASAVSSEGSGLRRATVTGAPVRDEVLSADRTSAGTARARALLNLPEGRSVIACIGGSLGARRLNDAALGLAIRFAGRGDLLVYHVAGARDRDHVVEAAQKAGIDVTGPGYRVVGFEANVPELFAVADLVVARAGAMTIAELAVIGAPSVLVPLPGAPNDHQRKNAWALSRAGAAVIVDDHLATGEHLGAVVESLLADEGRLATMTSSAIALGRRDAATAIASIVDDVAHARRRRRVTGGSQDGDRMQTGDCFAGGSVAR